MTPENKLNDHLVDSDFDEDEVDAKYDGQLSTHLVGDVSEVGMDQGFGYRSVSQVNDR